MKDLVENEADMLHFGTIHATDNFVPTKFLQNIIKIKFNLNNWKACDPPNSHCVLVDAPINVYIAGLNIAQIHFNSKTNGPANYVIDLRLDMGIELNFVIYLNFITLGDFQQALHLKLYSEGSTLGLILSKILMPALNLAVSIN